MPTPTIILRSMNSRPHLRDQVNALGRRVGYELRHPDALLRREIKVHVRRAIAFELSEHLPGRVSQNLYGIFLSENTGSDRNNFGLRSLFRIAPAFLRGISSPKKQKNKKNLPPSPCSIPLCT